METSPRNLPPGEDSSIATDVDHYVAKLGSWPQPELTGEEVIAPLSEILKQIEANPRYRERYPNVTATVYRMLGGAYLLHSKLELPDKIRRALHYLTLSLRTWPDQELLPQNVALLETFLRNGGGEIKDYLTAVLQILRGPGDPKISMLVDELTRIASGPEQQARSWLLEEATPNSIWSLLQALQIMLKKERNIDAEIEIATRMLQDNKVEVQAKVGPNVFVWDVDLAQQTFEAKNDLTRGFMGLIGVTSAAKGAAPAEPRSPGAAGSRMVNAQREPDRA